MPEVEQTTEMNLSSALEVTSSLLSQLEKAFSGIQASEDFSNDDDIHWEDVEGNFRHLESVMKKKLEELEAKQKIVSEKESVLAEKEAAIVAKEQDVLDKVQELKDLAVSAIIEARNANKVVRSVKDEIAGGKSPDRAEIADRVTEELAEFCERMDSKGILSYIIENVDNLSGVCRKQLIIAFESASDPARLVLDALGEFAYPNITAQNEEDVKRLIQNTRQSCLVLMEGLYAFLEKTECDVDKFLTAEAKHRAKALADEWKPIVSLDSVDAVNGKSPEARIFLWLLLSFRIVDEFDREELCKYILATAHHRQATTICGYLEIKEEIPVIVQSLVDNGRHVEAVHFIKAFKLSDDFQPIPLLKTYMKEIRKKLVFNGDPEIQHENNIQELAAIKMVMRCVKDHKLENEHPLDVLRKRFIQLHSAIRDKKRNKERFKIRYQKAQNSQAHISSGPPPFANDIAPYPDRYPPPGPSAYTYPVPHTSDQRPYSYPPVPGQSTHTVPGQTEPRAYYYSQDDRVSGSYSAGTPTYGSYVQNPQQPYM